MAAWDTPLASRLQPTGRAIEAAEAALRAGDPVAIPTPAVIEITRGLRTKVDAGD